MANDDQLCLYRFHQQNRMQVVSLSLVVGFVLTRLGPDGVAWLLGVG